MNNQRSSSDQIILFVLLSIGAMLIYNQFFGKRDVPQGPTRPAPALSAAFARIDPGNPANSRPLTLAEARAAKDKLQKEIDTNKEDDYSYWARLRAGLLEQYILSPKDPKPAKRYYDEIIYHAAGNDIEAQALHQKGNLIWNAAKASATNGDIYNSESGWEAVAALQQLIHRGRGSAFLSSKIYVPKGTRVGAEAHNSGQSLSAQGAEAQGANPEGANPEGANAQGAKIGGPNAGAEATVPGTTIPAQGFELATVSDLRHGPDGVTAKVDQYYRNTPFYKSLDFAVKLLGNQPAYSYGLAIILFASMTRLLLQPLNKKQYESMKGMQVIAPEMKKIQEKYKAKPDQQAQMMKEIQALQRRHGVNPMLGCGLALIQMPIFFLFVSPLIQHYEAKMELVGASFLWVRDLAAPDIPLLIIYAVSMFFSFRLSSVPPTDDMQRQQQIMMSFMFPLLFPFFLKDYPSAFTMYWMTFNVISTIFQYRMMKAADPNKSVVKSLLQSPVAPPAVVDESIPPRPQDNSGRDKTSKNGNKNGVKNTSVKPATTVSEKTASNKASKPGARAAKNGSVSGHSNGVAPINGAKGKELNGIPSTNGQSDNAENDEALNSTSEISRAATDGVAEEQNKKNGSPQNGNSQNGSSQRARRRRRY